MKNIQMKYRAMTPLAVVLGAALAAPLAPGAAVARQSSTARGGSGLVAESVFAISTIKGDVAVRRGASEEWIPAVKGDVLKPEDSFRSGENGLATITTPDGRKISIPASSIVDISDLRPMSPEDLLLRLAAEDLRSAPRKESGADEKAAKTTTSRAAEQNAGGLKAAGNGSGAAMRLNGTAVLFENGYFGSCVLKTREVFRAEPGLSSRADARIMVAQSFEKMALPEEAYEAYEAMSALPLDKDQRTMVDRKLKELGTELGRTEK